MGYALVRQFSSGDWESIDQDFRKGKIGSKEGYSRIVKILKGNERTILDFIQGHSSIDPFFKSFYLYCRERKMDLKIVSDGLDFYIEKILKIHHLSEIPFYANGAHFQKDGRMTLSFPNSEEDCGLCGTCKKKIIQVHRKEYDFIFFIGNGFSDRCAAQEANFVFAKETLYTYCLKKGIPCRFFKDFGEILEDFKKQMAMMVFNLDRPPGLKMGL